MSNYLRTLRRCLWVLCCGQRRMSYVPIPASKHRNTQCPSQGTRSLAIPTVKEMYWYGSTISVVQRSRQDISETCVHSPGQTSHRDTFGNHALCPAQSFHPGIFETRSPYPVQTTRRDISVNHDRNLAQTRRPGTSEGRANIRSERAVRVHLGPLSHNRGRAPDCGEDRNNRNEESTHKHTPCIRQ